MQNPTDQAETSIPTETNVREGPHLNPMGTFTVRRKAAKRSERWYQNVSALLSTPARKKPRLDEHLPTATDEATGKIASPDVSAGLPPPAADSDYANADAKTDIHSNAVTAGATGRWTPEEDAELTSAVAKTKKKWRGKVYKNDWVAAAALVPGRTNDQCRNRWRNALDPSIDWVNGRTGTWTEDEDLKLINSVQMHGGENWAGIAVMVPGRTDDQCRYRWKKISH
jgi:hypothetical protein